MQIISEHSNALNLPEDEFNQLLILSTADIQFTFKKVFTTEFKEVS